MGELHLCAFKHCTVVNFVISFWGNRVSPLGPPGTALQRLAGAQHLVLEHGCAVALHEKTMVMHRGELHALLRAREVRAQWATFLEVFVSDLQHATACDVFKWHSGAISTMGYS